MSVIKGFVFLDIETTGLDEDRGNILELGLVMYDLNYVCVQARSWLILDISSSAFLNTLDPDDPINKMHGSVALGGSGLIPDLLYPGDHTKIFTTAHAENEAISFAWKLGVNKSTPLCGSSVHFDRNWLKKRMPGLNDLFSYRNIDVSSDMELLRIKYPDLWKKIDSDPTKIKLNRHRVLDDIFDSVNLARRIDRHVFQRIYE